MGLEENSGPELQGAVEAVELQIRERMAAGEARRDAAVAVMWDVIRYLARGQDSIPQAVKDAVESAINRLATDEVLVRYEAASRTTAQICAPVFHHPGNPFTWEVAWAIGDAPTRRSGREVGPALAPLLHTVLAAAVEIWPVGDPRLAQLEGDLEEHAENSDGRLPGGMSSFTREWATATITFAPGTPSWTLAD